MFCRWSKRHGWKTSEFHRWNSNPERVSVRLAGSCRRRASRFWNVRTHFPEPQKNNSQLRGREVRSEKSERGTFANFSTGALSRVKVARPLCVSTGIWVDWCDVWNITNYVRAFLSVTRRDRFFFFYFSLLLLVFHKPWSDYISSCLALLVDGVRTRLSPGGIHRLRYSGCLLNALHNLKKASPCDSRKILCVFNQAKLYDSPSILPYSGACILQRDPPERR